MTDVVVYRKRYKLPKLGQPWNERFITDRPLRLMTGDRLYLAAEESMWGFSVVTSIRSISGENLMFTSVDLDQPQRVVLPCRVRHFVGYRYRWWDLVAELPFEMR